MASHNASSQAFLSWTVSIHTFLVSNLLEHIVPFTSPKINLGLPVCLLLLLIRYAWWCGISFQTGFSSEILPTQIKCHLLPGSFSESRAKNS